MTETPHSLGSLIAQWRDEEAKQCELAKRYVSSPMLYAEHIVQYEMAKRHASELEAALAGVAAQLAPQWQPIDTAPKDGTEILLTDGYWKRTGYWARRINAWSVDAVANLSMPTHWTPLPHGKAQLGGPAIP